MKEDNKKPSKKETTAKRKPKVTKLAKGGNNTTSYEPMISADIMSVNDVLKGQDGNEYIVKKVNGKKVWQLYNIFPLISASIMSLGDVLTSKDGGEYVVIKTNNEKVWRRLC